MEIQCPGYGCGTTMNILEIPSHCDGVTFECYHCHLKLHVEKETQYVVTVMTEEEYAKHQDAD